MGNVKVPKKKDFSMIWSIVVLLARNSRLQIHKKKGPWQAWQRAAYKCNMYLRGWEGTKMSEDFYIKEHALFPGKGDEATSRWAYLGACILRYGTYEGFRLPHELRKLTRRFVSHYDATQVILKYFGVAVIVTFFDIIWWDTWMLLWLWAALKLLQWLWDTFKLLWLWAAWKMRSFGGHTHGFFIVCTGRHTEPTWCGSLLHHGQLRVTVCWFVTTSNWSWFLLIQVNWNHWRW